MRKINIHMNVDNETLKYCREINAGIRNITDSIIVFDNESKMIPHITIIMGELDEQECSIEKIAERTKEIASGLHPIDFRVQAPYLENVVNKYVFSDTDGGQAFKDMKLVFKNKFDSKYLSNVGGSYGEQPPHLTLAHVVEKQAKVRDYLSSVKADFRFLSNSIEISDVGPKGTSINSLYLFKLKN